MADEFVATLDSGKSLSLEIIASELCSQGRYVLERSSANGMSLRFSTKERRSDWPEDFMLCCNGDDLSLTIHTATKHERVKIISDIEATLRRQNIQLHFQEA